LKNPVDFVSCSLNVSDIRVMELIKEIQRLPIQKRIYVIEKTIRPIRNQEDTNQMSKAANELLPDYQSDKELTVFTNFDYPDFYEAR
jgi:hypothetical protein